ncbi:sensor histidine kinase [Calothrix sp. PCC 6303]|uniref:sensor histidine kinase n=1 Tax=Calothrix sp. PCC 6303 TaxID=1170562 RepID=UPI0002A05061|nr:sensor histidine kinase [Calothrix sp. PCC 6303]AFZ04278.1 integral membrane sensor signal transduction histidine kinase [Calothrix sp. PCC 6303]
MIPLIQNRKYPLRFLLYLECILVSIVVSSEVFASLFDFASRLPRIPLLNIFCLVIFAVMGLKLPINRRLNQVLYTSLEFGLLILASMLGGVLLVPLLYTVIVIRNCLIFTGEICTVINGLAVILSLLTQVYRLQIAEIINPFAIREQLGVLLVISTLILGLGTIFIQMAVNALLQESQSRQELSVANAQLREYAMKVEELATVQERNRIAREIHDSVGHALTILNLHLEAALKLWQSDPAEATEFLRDAKKLGSNALQEVRQSITTLRVNPIAELSLADAIFSLAEDFRRSNNISPKLEIELLQPVKNEIQVAIYRIVQEALTNICKHAEATEVTIQITQNLAINELRLIVSDNGKGFDLEQNTTGFGLESMRERLTSLTLKGNFQVVTAPNTGCQVIADFPFS